MERTHRWFLLVFLLLFWYVPFLEGAEIAEEKPHPHVALVLSGGGAKGFAHIPIIEAIERAGIPIDMVIGTSMGSLVGGLYAAGYSPSDMYDLLEQYNMVELFAMTAVQRPKPIPQPLEKRRDNLFFIAFDEGGLGNTSGIIADQRILRVLNDALSRVVGIADFDKLVIPFRCVGADLVTGERVVFSSGSLVDAIRGSISIPLVFPPYPIGNQFIIDGGLVDNLPINLARSMGADIVIAVNVNAADYEISAEELSSLTAVLDHMLTLVTKNTLVGQLDNADLLVLPHLADIEMLDFTKVDEIIQIGKKEAKAYADDFALLAEKIAEKRPLVYRDPQRIGSYFSFPEVFIASVSHRALPGSPVADEPFDLTPFAEFIGYPLDEGRKKELYALCDAVRAQGTYATITYTITEPKAGPDGMVAGNLEIQTRAFEPKKGSFSVGAFGTASLNYDGQTGFETAYYPAFSFTFAYESFLDSPFHFTMQAVNDIAFQLRTALRYPLGKFFFAEADANFATGALQIASQERVFLLSPLMAVSFQKKNETLVRLSFDADFLWYSSDTVDDTLIPTVSLEAVYGNLPFGFFAPSGLRLDGSISCAWEEDDVGVRFEGRAQYAVGVSQRDTIALDVHAGGSRFTNTIRKNYLDYGGSDGMSSYPVHAMTDEMIIARAKYSRQISDNIVDSYLQALLAVGWRGSLITDPLYSNPHPLFGSLGSTEVAASLAFGLSTQFGDILVGLAGDTSRRFSLFVEVL